jgi:hypothetical protein
VHPDSFNTGARGRTATPGLELDDAFLDVPENDDSRVALLFRHLADDI